MTLAELSPPADEKVGRPRSIYTSPHIPSFHSDFLSFFLLRFSFTRRAEKKNPIRHTNLSFSVNTHIHCQSPAASVWLADEGRVVERKVKRVGFLFCLLFNTSMEGGIHAGTNSSAFRECFSLASKNPFILRLAFSAGIGGLLFGYDTGPSPPSLFLHVLYTQTRIFLYLLRICFLVFFL